MNTTAINLNNLTDAEIENLKAEAQENMSKSHKAGDPLTASKFYSNFAHLSSYLRNRQMAQAFGKWNK